MPWYFPWSDAIKKRACRYLLQRYLGQFLQEKLSLDQLSVDLYSGKGTISDVYLDVEALNEIGETYNLPIEFVDGYISSISVSIPWSALLNDNSNVEVHGLMMTIQPKQRSVDASIFDSMWGSMTTSMQLAEECLRQEPSESEKEAEASQPFEGLELFAQTIETVLCRIKVRFFDTVIRIEHMPKEGKSGVALEMHLKKVDYFDEAGTEVTSAEGVKKRNIYEPVAFSVKKFYMEGTSLYTDEFPHTSRTFARSLTASNDSSPPSKSSEAATPGSPEMPPPHSPLYGDSASETQQEPISDPVLISRLSGQQQIRLKLKQNEAVLGPKVDVEFNFGPVAMFLSPRQVHILLELARGLAQPDLEDRSNVLNGRATRSKPMGAADYALVEQELQRQLVQPLLPSRSLQQHQGWSSHSLDDSDEEFLPMTTGGNATTSDQIYVAPEMESSCSSLGSNTTKSSASVDISSQTLTSTVPTAKKTSVRSRGPVHGLLQDTLTELTQFCARCSSLCIIILHDDAVTCAAMSTVTGLATPSLSTVSVMKLKAEKFFDDLAAVTMAGYTFRDFDAMRIQLSSICKTNHLRLLAAPLTLEGNEKSSSAQWLLSSSVTVANLEILECLFDRVTGKNDFLLPQYTEILSFSNELLKSGNLSSRSEPCLRLKCQQIERASQRRSLNQPGNTFELHLGQLYTEVDISIMDRIHALLNPQPLCGITEKYQDTTTHIWNEEDHPVTLSEKTNIFVSSPFVVIAIRFPIPDLRPLHDMDRVPWWQQNIQKDALILELLDASLTTSIDSTESDIICELQCKDGHGLYQSSSSEQPVSFLRVSVDPLIDSNARDGFGWPRLVVRVSPPNPISVLEAETLIDREESIQATSLDAILCQMDPEMPSLFTTRRIIHETDIQSDSDGGDKPQNHASCWEADQVIMPADKYRILDFIHKTLNNARYTFEFTLPTANLILPNKHFYEVLYNRLTTDLVLWEPAAPRPMRPCDSHVIKIQAPGLDLANHLTQDKTSGPFSMCTSGLQYDSSSDSEESGGVFYSVCDSQKQRRKHPKTQMQNMQTKSAVTINVARGKITLHTPLRDVSGSVLPGQQSELQLHVEDAQFFAASSYRGNPNDSYICLQANRATLYHNGMLPETLEHHKVEVVNLIPPSHLYTTIYRSESGMLLEQGVSVGLGGDSLDMLTVAININMDEEQFIKTYKVALGIRGATLHHRMTQSSQSWLTQFIDFFDVEDYPVSGYQPPSVVTELHLHLFSCAIDYRPLYLPLRAALTVENFSISSNISAQTTTSVLRVIAEELCLFISNKTDGSAMNLKQNYVCVVDTGLFDFSVRMTDGKDPLHPKLELKASNNIVHIRTCSDSFQALQSLLTYVASDGDFFQEFTTRSSEVHHLVSEGGGEATVVLSKSQVDQVHDLMAEAMKESIASQNSSPVELKNPHFSDNVALEPVMDHYEQDLIDEIDALSADEEFCILEDDPGIGIAPKSGESQVRLLTTETVRLIENHFSVPSGKTDQLKAPKHFPPALLRYTLREMSLILHLYGGNDFDVPKPKDEKSSTEKHVRIQDGKREKFGEMGTRLHSSIHDQSYSPTIHFKSQGMGVSFNKTSQELQWNTIQSPLKGHHNTSLSWKVQGGKNRQHDVLMELEMHKVRFQHEIYPEGTEQASRQVLLIHDVEIRDRLATSQINKFLYQYASEAMPRQSHANMIVIKAVHIRPDPSLPTQECSLRVSIKPLRLNIDQDALLFLYNFFSDAYNISGNKEESDVATTNTAKNSKSSGATVHQSPVMGVTSPAPSGLTPTEPNGLLILLQERAEEACDLITPLENWEPIGCNGTSATAGANWGNTSAPIFFRSFTFSPDVPIRLDYEGKRLDMDQGVLAGILMGLGQLSCSELRLKRLSYRHGLLGLDKLLSFALNEWLQDIKRNQLPSLLGGVGPMHSFVQLFQGIRDLFWLPIEQYRKDGRIVRGLQRGANSFTTSTAMACLELTNRLVQTIQGAAEFAYDMVSPGPSVKSHTQGQRKWQVSTQKRFPADIREGMATAFHVVREGLGDTARTIVRVAAEECEHKGVPGAVGGVLRQIPPSVVKPIILATEATSSVLGGVRSQLVRDAHREAVDKWRAEPSHL